MKELAISPEIRLSHGTVVTDALGVKWVFTHYQSSTVGTYTLNFTRCNTVTTMQEAYTYRAMRRETLIAKFPDILQHELMNYD